MQPPGLTGEYKAPAPAPESPICLVPMQPPLRPLPCGGFCPAHAQRWFSRGTQGGQAEVHSPPLMASAVLRCHELSVPLLKALVWDHLCSAGTLTWCTDAHVRPLPAQDCTAQLSQGGG